MAFNPKPHKDIVYISGDKRYKVVSFTEKEIVVVRLKTDNSEDSSSITWTEKQWNGKNLRKESSGGENDDDKSEKRSNSFTFDIDDDGNLTFFQNGKPIKRFNVRGPEGKPGKDGMPGQDGAPGQKGQDGATGQPGKDGTPGEKGQDGTPGPEGKQGTTGPKGEDGVYWYPEISEDGTQLRFKNRNNSSDVTEWYNIKGCKGDTGSEGPRGKVGPVGPVFIPSVNSDGELSWSNTGHGLTNPTTRNIKGDKGDKGDKGATFHPIVKDGVLYWYDDKGNLAQGITPVKIAGAQGKQGEQGAQGLSAYQIWLKQGYQGTEQDFLDSLKGEKGTPAPPASFSFKDVEDFTCAIQKIDTNLIVDKDDDTDSPEEIVDKKIKAIADLREKGKQLGSLGYYIKNWLKETTWWCAGADRNLLRMCPGDHSKYVGVGTVIIFTALMAFFSSSIALNLVFKPEEGEEYSTIAIIGGFIWALMIFFLDRFITNTMYSDGKVTISKEEFFSGLPRIVIAIFLGIVISAPLEIKIFNQEIKEQLNTNIASIVHDNVINDIRYKNVSDNLSIAKTSFDAANTQLQKTKESEGDSTKYYKATKTASRGGTERVKVHDPETGRWVWQTQSKADNVTKSNDYDAALFAAAIKRDSLTVEGEKSKFVALQRQLQDTDSLLTMEYADKYDVDSLGLYEHLAALHYIAMKDYEPWEWCGPTLDTILHSWWWFLFNSAIGLIMLLFILIDISPVLYKMMLADGNYDNYLHQEKLLAQDKIRLSLSNMLKKLNDSELQLVAPFIMGDIYEKMAGDSYIYKTKEELKSEMATHKKTNWFWRIWPFSMIRWIFWKEDDKPSAPVIVLNPKEPTANQQAVINTNNEVFEEVLDMKKKIILASYRRWYKTQHDCIICDDVNDENKGKEPFEEDSYPPNDFDNDNKKKDQDDNDDDERDDNDPFDDEETFDDEVKYEESDSDDTQEANADSNEETTQDPETSDDTKDVEEDDDEHELPEDDGDDRLNN